MNASRDAGVRTRSKLRSSNRVGKPEPSESSRVSTSSFSAPLPLEPERYELHAAPIHHFDLDRRDFFKTLSGGIVVLFLLEDVPAQESGGGRSASLSASEPAITSISTVRPLESWKRCLGTPSRQKIEK